MVEENGNVLKFGVFVNLGPIWDTSFKVKHLIFYFPNSGWTKIMDNTNSLRKWGKLPAIETNATLIFILSQKIKNDLSRMTRR